MLKSIRSVTTAMTSKLPPRPVVAVVGTTGVGKSQLAVSLARSLKETDDIRKAVILSADSMQLYKGLDVITNKVTEEEKGGVEHWGLDVVQPGEGGSWELGRWCKEAERKMESLPDFTLPIICGGTHYFIQHFLFPPKELSFDRPRDQQEARASNPLATRWTPPGPCPPTPASMSPELRRLLDTFWTTEASFPEADSAAAESVGTSPCSRPTITNNHELLCLWQVLDCIDPDEAKRWHWKDGRKVRRGIERWWERGGRKVEPQTFTMRGATEGRQARFRTLLFWVYESMDSLKPRLDGRVDRMVANGLLREIEELRQIAIHLYGSAQNTDHSEGIFQAIGYKEFANLHLPQEHPETDKQFQMMLDRMKVSTHQYAKSQIKWIKKQLLPAVKEARDLGGDVHLYVVPGGPAGEAIARTVLDAFLQGKTLPDPQTTGHPNASLLTQSLFQVTGRIPDTAERQILNARRVCDVCSEPGNPYSVKAAEWQEHLKSRIHRRKSKFITLSREEWIEEQRRKGLAKKAARSNLRENGSITEANQA